MKFSGTITVAAPRDQVFGALEDAKFFASCVEGVRDMHEVDASHYTAVMETKVAYIRFKFDVTATITRREPPAFIEAKIEGVPSGIVGRLTGISKARLEEIPDGTAIHYEIDVALAGKLGALGQPVLKSKARDMEKSFTIKLRSAFGEVEAPA